jgi:hypothetical protein
MVSAPLPLMPPLPSVMFPVTESGLFTVIVAPQELSMSRPPMECPAAQEKTPGDGLAGGRWGPDGSAGQHPSSATGRQALHMKSKKPPARVVEAGGWLGALPDRDATGPSVGRRTAGA